WELPDGGLPKPGGGRRHVAGSESGPTHRCRCNFCYRSGRGSGGSSRKEYPWGIPVAKRQPDWEPVGRLRPFFEKGTRRPSARRLRGENHRYDQPHSRYRQPLWCYLLRYVEDRKSTRLNSSHVKKSYADFSFKKKNN